MRIVNILHALITHERLVSLDLREEDKEPRIVIRLTIVDKDGFPEEKKPIYRDSIEGAIREAARRMGIK